MKNILSIAAAFAVSVAFTQAADEAKPAEKPAAPAAEKPADKPAAPAKGDAFAKKDTNNDGFLSKEEFTAGAKDAAKAEAAFTKKDADKDGKLSKDEFSAGAGKGAPKKK